MKLHPISLNEIILRNLDNYELDSFINTVYNYDLSLMQLVKKGGILPTRKREISAVEFMSIPSSQVFLQNSRLVGDYIEVLIGKDSDLFSMKEENFVHNLESGRLATKGFEAVLDDYTGKVPIDVKMNVGTVALLMTKGVMELPEGNEHIENILKRYGKVSITRGPTGFLHISVGDIDKTKFIYRETITIPEGKSLI